MSKEKEKKIGPAKGKTAAEGLITGGAIIAALVLANVLAGGSRAKLDLTDNNIYSLSDASKGLVRRMPERVNVRAYFGNVPPEQAEKMNYVDALLSEYAESSGGKIDYQRIDPWDKPDLQEELKKEGIDKLRLQSRKDDSIQLVPMYFQVVFSHLDKKEVWTPEATFALEGLEYDFSSRIKRLGYGKKKVGVTTGFGEPGQQQMQALASPGVEVALGVKVGLGDLYDVSFPNWKTDPKSIDDVDVLIVNGPTEKVSDAAKYHLDQFVMRGKPVLILAAGMSWSSPKPQQQLQMQQPDQPFMGVPQDPGLGDLLAAYGFEIGKNVILDFRNSARYWVPVGGRQGLPIMGFAPIAQALANGPHDILASVPGVALPFPSTLKLIGPLDKDKRAADTQVVELLRTAPTSFEHDEVFAITQATKVPKADKGNGPYLVAAAVTGQFKSAYADKAAPAEGTGPKGPDEGEADPPPATPPPAPAGPLKESAAHTRMVVVSAPSLTTDESILAGRNVMESVFVNNLVVAHDLVDWLAEDNDLVAMRSKKVERPLAKLETGERNLIKYGNIVGAPLLLIAFGVVYWRVRERRRQHIVL